MGQNDFRLITTQIHLLLRCRTFPLQFLLRDKSRQRKTSQRRSDITSKQFCRQLHITAFYSNNKNRSHISHTTCNVHRTIQWNSAIFLYQNQHNSQFLSSWIIICVCVFSVAFHMIVVHWMCNFLITLLLLRYMDGW